MKKNAVKSLVIWLSLIYIANSYAQKTEETIVFKNVNLIPMTSEVIIPNQTVIVNGSRIAQISDNDKLVVPKNSIVIDGTGKYLMPGLVDMHTHHLNGKIDNKEIIVYDQNSNSNLFLKME